MLKIHKEFNAYLLGIQLFIIFIQFLDIVDVWFYPMINRSVYSIQFDLDVNLTFILFILLLVNGINLIFYKKYFYITILFILSLICNRFFEYDYVIFIISIIQLLMYSFFYSIKKILNSTMILLIVLEFLTLVSWIFLPFGIDILFPKVVYVQRALFYMLSYLSPIVLLGICIVALRKFLVKSNHEFMHKNVSETVNNILMVYRKPIIVLCILLNVLLVLYPYNRVINPNLMTVGVDAIWYEEWMSEVDDNVMNAFSIDRGSRPFVLLLIWVIKNIFNVSNTIAIRYLPVLLYPLFSYSVYFLIYNSVDNLEWALFSMFFSMFGFISTVGLYSYYLSNILALSLLFFSMGLLFKFLNGIKEDRRLIKLYFYSLFIGIVTLFVHNWTVVQYLVCFILFSIYILNRYNEKRVSLYVILYIISLLMVDIIKNYYMGSLSSYESITDITSTISYNFLNLFWNKNIMASRFLYSGLMSNTLFLMVSLYGIYKIRIDKYLSTYIIMLIIPSYVASIFTSHYALSRLIYNIPFSIYYSYGMYVMYTANERYENNNHKILFLYLVIYQFNYVLSSYANLM